MSSIEVSGRGVREGPRTDVASDIPDRPSVARGTPLQYAYGVRGRTPSLYYYYALLATPLYLGAAV